jgi:hypothetical protein
MRSTPGDNTIRIFWRNLCYYLCNLSQNNKEYADAGVTYAKKVLYHWQKESMLQIFFLQYSHSWHTSYIIRPWHAFPL